MNNRMRAGISAGLAVVVVFTAGAARGQTDFTVISALGDSLTESAAARGPNHAEHIAQKLGTELNNFGISGATTTTLLTSAQHIDAVEAGTTFAFLWIGSNDLIFEFGGQAVLGDTSIVEGIVANWSEAADVLIDSGATVIAANIPNIASLPVFTDNAEIQPFLPNVESVTIALNEALAVAAAERGIPLVDVFSLFEQLVKGSPTVCAVEVGLPPLRGSATDLFFDEIHPTSYGMGLVTNAFIDVMNESFDTALVRLTPAELGALAGLDACDAELPTDNDSDNDGVIDGEDVCPGADDSLDSDDDGTPDCADDCPDDAAKTDPGACGCGVADTDTDDDGTLDCDDGCPEDANKIETGVCGCGQADADTDSDGTPDCNDGCPDDADKVDGGVCGCGESDADTDADGVLDCIDNCPDDVNTIQTDSDGDGIGDACDSAGGGNGGGNSGGSSGGGFCAVGITSLLPLMLLGVVGLKRRLRRHQ